MSAEYRHVVGLGIGKVYVTGERVLSQCFLHGGVDYLENKGIILELDLRLRRADVDVDIAGICLEIDEIGGSHPFSDQSLVGSHHSFVEIRAAEIPAVDEEELVPQSLPGGVRPAGESPQADQGGVRGDVDKVPGDRGSHQIHYPVFEGLGWPQDKDVLAVVREREARLRASQSHLCELLDNVLELDIVRLQELSPGRNIIEEVSDCYVGSHRSGNLGGGNVL